MRFFPNALRARLILYGPLALFVICLGAYLLWSLWMPGHSHSGPLPPLTATQRKTAHELRAAVSKLAGEIGERHVGRPKELAAASDFVQQRLSTPRLPARAHSFNVGGVSCRNLEATVPGTSLAHEVVVVGAHYDSAPGSPGANDNASAVAALLELHRRFASRTPRRTIRFVAFVNEEPPFYRTRNMGSLRYARQLRARNEQVVAMLSLETIGYYSDEERTQKYPFPLGWFYPSTGNFIAFVANGDSRRLLRRAVATFRRDARFPSLGAALPEATIGVGWSDHWSFWKAGYPGVMVTDTALMRYPHYHQATDTPDRIDYERLARVVDGLDSVVADLANSDW